MNARRVFWASAGLLVYTQVGYPLLLEVLARATRPGRGSRAGQPAHADARPTVSLIVAAHAEQDVIAAKVANTLALEHPRDRLQVIVACDGSPDDTPARARAAGADLVLDLPRGGKVRAQDAAVREATGAILAFSDANAQWEPDALSALLEPFAADPRVGYVCGQVRFVNPQDGTNQEGLYWRYEMWIRARESELSSVTGGNGAIYATRCEAYVEMDAVMGHDLSFPFTMVKRGWRAVYAPGAQATEKMAPSLEGELARKRRMMSHAWPIVLRGSLLDPRGYPPLYGLMIASHRVLRYAAPGLHALALASAALATRRAPRSLPAVGFAAQLALLAAAAAGASRPSRPWLIARYYVLTNVAVVAGLWDHLRHGTPAGWAPPEGTR